jgi:hypothetical protein
MPSLPLCAAYGYHASGPEMGPLWHYHTLLVWRKSQGARTFFEQYACAGIESLAGDKARDQKLHRLCLSGQTGMLIGPLAQGHRASTVDRTLLEPNTDGVRPCGVRYSTLSH